jgi:hypothetical protein
MGAGHWECWGTWGSLPAPVPWAPNFSFALTHFGHAGSLLCNGAN